MKITDKNGPEFDLSRDATLLISAIVSSADHDEALAHCLMEWGIVLCAELGIDAEEYARRCQNNLVMKREEEQHYPPEETNIFH